MANIKFSDNLLKNEEIHVIIERKINSGLLNQ